MQSVSPYIIKHFIPIDFSKNIIDRKLAPKKVSKPKDNNPLQNMKLKNIDKNDLKDCILTFTNKTNRQFLPKKQIIYKRLMQELEEEHMKMTIIKSKVKEDIQQHQEQCPEGLKIHLKTHTQHQHEKNTQRQNHSATGGRYQHATPSRIKSTPNTSRNANFRKISSSHHIRIGSLPFYSPIKAKTILEKEQWGSVGNDQLHFLKIKGSKAPQLQIMDHLKRNTSEGGHLFYRTFK